VSADHAQSRFSQALAVSVCLVSPLVHLLAFGPAVPEGTFFLISRLAGSAAASDPGNLVHAFARPPAFELMGWVFSYPFAYLAVGYLSHVLMHGVLFWLALIGTREAGSKLTPDERWLTSLALVVLVFPLSHVLRLDDRGLSLIPHDSFHVFSHRTLFWSLMAAVFGCLATGRTRWATWLTALSSTVHPSAGILAFAIVVPLVVVALVRRRDRGGALHLLAALFMGALPTFYKKITLGLPPELTRPLGYGDWYSSMIKDEADDFSFVYQLVYQPKMLVLVFGAIALGLVVHARLVPAYRSRLAFLGAALPLALFALGLAIEVVCSVLVPTPLTLFVVALTPGYRLLSYAFFPLFLLAAELSALGVGRLVERWFSRENAAHRGRFLRVGALSLAGAACAALVATGKPGAVLSYARWTLGAGRVDGVDEYFLGASSVPGEHLVTPKIFRVNGPFVTYPGERDLLEIRRRDREQPRSVLDPAALAAITPVTYADICRQIRQRVSAGAGIVIPPYLRHFRDSLVEHAVFLQEHHDGNLMMGSPAFLGFFAERMRDLMGFDYEGMPSKHSRLNFTAMRTAYLSIDGPRARRLLERYPGYPYFLSEASHLLPFRVVARNAAFVLYDMRAPVSP